MKNILSILLVSIILIGCSENRVLIDELTNKGSKGYELMYYEGGLFNGIGFDVFTDGSLEREGNYKDGKKDGLWKWYYKNGQISNEGKFKEGVLDVNFYNLNRISN